MSETQIRIFNRASGLRSLLLVTLAFCLSIGSAQAAEESATGTSISTLPAAGSGFRGTSRFDELTLTAGQESYLTRDTSARANPGAYTLISSHLRAHTEDRPISGTIDIGGTFATDVENYSNIEAPEAYMKWESDPTRTSRTRIILGRKRERWSGVDNDWALGLVQPLNKFDGLRPSEQGLTGAFIGWARGGFDALVFGSSIFVPEQGAPFELQNGRFSTNSPWFSRPPERLVLFDQERPVNYKLETPSVGSIINHPSAGLMLRASDFRGHGFFGQTGFLRSPRNSLALPFTGKLRLENTTNYGDVTVYPEVVYHNVTTADFGYTNERVSTSLGVLWDVSDEPSARAETTYQRIKPLVMASPSVEFRMFASRAWAPRVRLSYLKSWGGESETLGENAANGNVFGPTVPYRDATSVAFQSVLFRSGRFQLEQGFRWIEELSEQGTVLMADARLKIGAAWRVTLSGDLLGSRQDATKTDTFIARYRGNDRVAARVTFVF